MSNKKEKLFNKKENKRLLIVFIILLLCSIAIEIYLKIDNNNITYMKNIEEYKLININEIQNIEIVKIKDGEDLRNVIEDEENIKKIYNLLGNIKIENKVKPKETSNSIFYIFSLKDDNTYTISFKDNNIFLNEKYYKTSGLQELDNLDLS